MWKYTTGSKGSDFKTTFYLRPDLITKHCLAGAGAGQYSDKPLNQPLEVNMDCNAHLANIKQG